MKKSILYLIALGIIFTIGCGSNKSDISNEKIDFSNADIVEDSDLYKVKEKDGKYCVSFINEKGDEAEIFDTVDSCPVVTDVKDDVLKITLSNGSDVSWYYDIENEELSNVISGADSEYGRMIAVIDESKIIIQDAFNEEILQEITEFGQEMEDISEPIISAEFTEDGSELIVNYYNTASEEVVENLALNIK